ncbi:MAG: DUF177 domain-containing protein [Polaribacter sp.]|nr:DUF177 domain-containing protein [Polaribacter sp.]
MKDLKQFNIHYTGLKDESHLFEYQIDNTFFKAYHFDDFFETNINVALQLEKKSTFLDLSFTAKGTINIACDVSGEPFDQEISASLALIVKFGETFNDENEEVLILPYSEFQLNVAQYIYEMIVLAVPSKRIHPKVIDGSMESDALNRLETLRVQKTTEDVDPRWDKLKSLIIDKKT